MCDCLTQYLTQYIHKRHLTNIMYVRLMQSKVYEPIFKCFLAGTPQLNKTEFIPIKNNYSHKKVLFSVIYIYAKRL